MRMKFKTYLLLLPVMLLFAQTARAQWPIGKYRDEFVTSFNYYGATDSWDQSGKRITGTGSRFDSYSIGLYNVYGLTRHIDIETSLPLIYFKDVESKGNLDENYGAGDLMAGLNFNLWNGDFTKFLNFTASGIVPLYDAKSNPLGYGEGGAEAKLAYFTNISPDFIKGSYFTIDAAYRRYFGTDGPNQYIGNATLGLSVARYDQILVNAGYVYSQSANKAFNSAIIDIKDFQYLKTQLTYGHIFSRRLTMYWGGFFMPYGRNTGAGYGGSFSTVLKL